MSEPMKIDIFERLLNDRPNEAMMREAVGEIRRLRSEVTLRTDQLLALDAAMTEHGRVLADQLRVAVEALEECREVSVSLVGKNPNEDQLKNLLGRVYGRSDLALDRIRKMAGE